MATSGTYAYAPSAGDLILNAFGMVQIRRPQLTQEHLENAHMAASMVMVDFSNRNPNRWAMETQTVSLVEGTPTYDLEPRTLAVVLGYIDTSSGSTTRSRVLGPLSANDYGSIPVKLQPGSPTSLFFNLLTPIPTITVWPCPDGNGPYSLKLQTFRQMQDVVIAGGVSIDAPYRFLDAALFGIASRLAVYYPTTPPALSAKDLDGMYLSKFNLAAARDQETTPMYVVPQLGGYFR
jgi:hypothetical protein